MTGASAGIGRGVACRLAEAGAAVALHYRGGKESALAAAQEIRDAGGKAIAVNAELTDPASVEEAVRLATEQLGPIDILVNNAARQTHAGFEDMALEEWREMLAANLDGVFITTKLVTAQMIKRRIARRHLPRRHRGGLAGRREAVDAGSAARPNGRERGRRGRGAVSRRAGFAMDHRRQSGRRRRRYSDSLILMGAK